MAIPGPLCTVLMYGGELLPFTDQLGPVVSILSIAAAYVLLIAEAYPLPSAFVSGYEVGKHPLFFAVVLYLVVSIAIVAGLLPVCEAAAA